MALLTLEKTDSPRFDQRAVAVLGTFQAVLRRQRVATARALVNRPEVVLADELIGNFNSRTNIETMRLFQELNEAGNILVIVTHGLDIAAYRKRVIVMPDGNIIGDFLDRRKRSATAGTVTQNSIALAFGVSFIIGVFFGFYPARKAAALNPIEAL